MATDYPDDIDSFTNPTRDDHLDSPNHADQHADANDAILAIETELGVNPQGSGNLFGDMASLLTWMEEVL